MLYYGTLMNISNLYRTFDAGDCHADRSAFFIMTGETWANVDFERTNWIRIHYGAVGIDDAWMNPLYLATLRENGGYQVECADRYLETWNEEWTNKFHPKRVIDIRHLPDAVAGTTFHKALSYSKQTQYSFNRWRSGVVSENGCGALLEPEHSFEKYLRVDFADHALVCDGRAISRLELLPDRDDTHTDNGNDKVLMLAQQLLETPCEVSERQLRAWLAEYGCRIKADGKSVESK